jgi:hypothetical protein
MRIISICALSTSGGAGLFARTNTTKTLAFAIQVQENTKPNENDSHYKPDNVCLPRIAETEPIP